MLLTEHDIPWLVYLCDKRYPKRFDSITTEGWFRNVVLKSPVMFLPQRMPGAFAITMISIVPWLPAEPEANVVFICADDGCMWEALKLTRASIEWARKRKCARWKICSDADDDLKALAFRMGAKEIFPRYELVL